MVSEFDFKLHYGQNGEIAEESVRRIRIFLEAFTAPDTYTDHEQRQQWFIGQDRLFLESYCENKLRGNAIHRAMFAIANLRRLNHLPLELLDEEEDLKEDMLGERDTRYSNLTTDGKLGMVERIDNLGRKMLLIACSPNASHAKNQVAWREEDDPELFAAMLAKNRYQKLRQHN